MSRYDLINKEWIVSPTARLVYRAAAVASLAFIPVIVAIQLTYPTPTYLKQLLFVSILGVALTTIGMEYFLFRFDDSGALKQIFWFCAMFFFPIGPALYCSLVYSRSKLHQPEAASGQQGAVSSIDNRDLH